MRIVHVIDYFQPKLGYQETFLAGEHARLGHDVYVVTSDRYNPIVYSGDAGRPVMGSRIVGNGFSIEEGIQIWRLKTLFEIPHIIWVRGLERKIQELKSDVVIMHGIANLFAIRIARLKSKTGSFKLIYDEHMLFSLSRGKMRILYPLFQRLFSNLIQQTADALVAILPETKAFMHEKYGIPLNRIAIIPLGADNELFRFDAVARQEVRRELALKEDDVVFIYTGKIIPQKKLRLLIKAAANLAANHNNIKVMLVGSGSESHIGELKHDIKTKNLEGIFIWHEAVPNNQLYRVYAAADAAVWPSGPSIGMREAMACDLPIIISEDSAVSELVAYNNGFTFREEDVLQLTQQMTKLLDLKQRKEMGRNSRRFIEEKLNWKIIAEQFINQV